MQSISHKSFFTRAAGVLVFGIFLSHAYALAGINSWTSGGPSGGNVQQVVIDPSTATTLYSVTEYRIYKN